MNDNAPLCDWVGTSGRRKREPFTAPTMVRYVIPHGTECVVKKVGQSDWRAWQTKRYLEFRKPERETEGDLTFRRDAWLLRVGRDVVRVREAN